MNVAGGAFSLPAPRVSCKKARTSGEVVAMISVLLPIHNERENIRPVVAELDATLVKLERPYEIICVDDGSTDGSRGVLNELAAEQSSVKVIFFRRNVGQTSAFDAGFRHARGDIIVTMDSDGQNDPKDIPTMIAMLDDGVEFVAGWRKDRKDGLFLRKIPSRIANWIIRRVTKTKIHDLGCSLKAYRKEVVRELRLYGEMHRFIGVLVEGAGAKVAELVVNHRPRAAGTSKYGLARTFKVMLDLLTVWFLQGYITKPLYVFGGAGGSLVTLSGALSVYVLWEKFSQGIWVHRNPLFIIAMFVGVIGILFFGLGLLAEVIVRTYFESSGTVPYPIARRVGFDETVRVEASSPRIVDLTGA